MAKDQFYCSFLSRALDWEKPPARHPGPPQGLWLPVCPGGAIHPTEIPLGIPGSHSGYHLAYAIGIPERHVEVDKVSAEDGHVREVHLPEVGSLLPLPSHSSCLRFKSDPPDRRHTG